MAVVITYNKPNVVGKYRQRLIRVDYGNGDTSLTVPTRMKLIESYTISPTSVTAKPWDYATVSGGTITVAVNDPLAACYLFIVAVGL
jgi:hypothetical protein